MSNIALPIITYHYVRPKSQNRFKNLYPVDLEDFRNQLNYLTSHYNFTDVPSVIEAANGNPDALPPDPVLLSFDDGYQDHFKYVLPELQKRKISGAFFISVASTGNNELLDVNKIQFILSLCDNNDKLISEIEFAIKKAPPESLCLTLSEYKRKYWKAVRYVPAEQIYIKRMLQIGLPQKFRKDLVTRLFTKYVTNDENAFASDLYLNKTQASDLVSAGMHLGAHGKSHMHLGEVSPSNQKREIVKSRDFIFELYGTQETDWTFCYPHGSYNDQTLKILNANGCSLAFSSMPGVYQVNQHPKLLLPRINARYIPPPDNRRIDG